MNNFKQKNPKKCFPKNSHFQGGHPGKKEKAQLSSLNFSLDKGMQVLGDQILGDSSV